MISIIVPVYNAEKQLPHCIDSILAQSISDWELILVDDGSQDASLSICKQYADNDSRIKIFHKTNEGPGSARNYGIDKSKAEYVCFVDADDWIEPFYLEQFITFGMDEYDLLIQGLIYEHNKKKVRTRILNSKCYTKDHFAEAIRDNDLLDYGSPCCKLFRKTLLHQHKIIFPTNYHYGEDSIFYLRYLRHCNKLRCIPYQGYHYVMYSEESLSRKTHPSQDLFHYLCDENTIYSVLLSKSYDADLLQKLNEKHVMLAKRAYINMFRLDYKTHEKVTLMAHFANHIRPLLSSSNLSLPDKLFLLFSRFPGRFQEPLFNLLCKLKIIQVHNRPV